uniref:Uncharacterized protein n=1 Tax=Leptobrachium leishanense TaxID=445787 RepID=A0A8C5WK07_9ANUR
MVRGKKTEGGTQTPRKPSRSVPGPIDGFLSPPAPADFTSTRPDKMAAARGGPEQQQDPFLAISRLEKLVTALPTKTDLSAMMEEFRAGMHHELREVRVEVAGLTDRVGGLEDRANIPPEAPPSLLAELSDMKRKLDDLDNRGRRQNVRIRGLPESVITDDIATYVDALFVTLIQDPAITSVPVDRAHRVLRPMPPEGAPPRDVVCRISSGALKERVMSVARTQRQWLLDGHQLEFFQDLTPFTLAARKALRPITLQLRQRQIAYRWGFPFALHARTDGITAAIYRPADVPDFLTRLDLPPTLVINWEEGGYADRRVAADARPLRPQRRPRPLQVDRARSPSPEHLGE